MNIRLAFPSVAASMAIALCPLLSSCGGGGGSGVESTPLPKYKVGGSLSGLTGTVVLQDNGGDNLSLSADGVFTFATTIVSGGTYSVTVLTQPTNQICAVSGGSGTVTAAVSAVSVTCTNTHSLGGTVSGLFGAGLVIANGTDSIAVPIQAQVFTLPQRVLTGTQYSVTIQSQASGLSCSVSNGAAAMPDNDVATVQILCVPMWAWISGQHTDEVAGVYGTKGIPDAGNVPGGRQFALSWADSAGHLWLFGGIGYGEGFVAGYADYLNDLWSYDTSTGLWVWVSGSTTSGAPGVYGTQGVGAITNTPGSRGYSVTWTDSNGNLWLFGGYGADAAGNPGDLNDLWKFNPATHQWTWVSGNNTINAPGVYGTKGTAASANVPGARYSPMSWIDGDGNLWLYGGNGYLGDGTNGGLGDLWKYSPTAGTWTWVAGSNSASPTPVYGAQNVPDPTNDPGARSDSTTWYDGSGNLWLFAGHGLGTTNDLWKYELNTGLWTWVSGTQQSDSPASYGTQGVPSPTNVPGSRYAATGWTDAAGNLWLFGGYGTVDANAPGGFLSDIWKFDRATSQWTWVAGSNELMTTGVYGVQGTADPANAPGGRNNTNSWVDSNGSVWLFGGQVWGPSTLSGGYFNDLWKY